MISHLNTLVWLQFVFFRRGFTELLKIRFGRVISITICIALAGLILALFALGLFAGNIVGDLANDQILQGRNPNGFFLMVAVDVALIPFLSFWLIGLLAEFMRDEPLDFRRVLFLPIPLSTVFILNFSIAIISPLALVFTVPLISFSISAAISLGPHMLLAIPLGFIFYIALAGGTYYLRGIISFLMRNKRRRRMMLMVLPLIFVVPTYLPVVLIDTDTWISFVDSEFDSPVEISEEDEALTALAELSVDARNETRNARWSFIATSANSVVPLGWLPLGLAALLEGRFLALMHASASITAIAGFGLYLGYRSTLDFYTQPPKPYKTRRQVEDTKSRRPLGQRLFDLDIPNVDSTAIAVSVGAFLSILRNPGIWAQILSPLFTGIFVFIYVFSPDDTTFESMNNWGTRIAPTAIIMFPCFSAVILCANIFGSDIGAFRSYVLMPTPRWKYLYGNKITLILGTVATAFVLLLLSWPLLHYSLLVFIIAILQALQVSLTICIVGNTVSIYFPYHTDPTATRRTFKQQLVLMAVGLALSLLIALLSIPPAFGMLIDAILDRFWGYQGISVGMLRTLAIVIIVTLLYRFTLPKLGSLLHQREKIILNRLMKEKR